MRSFIIVLLVAATHATYKNENENENENVGRSDVCGILPSTCPNSRYRSYDGSCNNLKNPTWGTPFTAYARLARSSYSDGVHAFPLTVDKKPLMNARDVSLQVSPDVVSKDPEWTIMTLQFGQGIAHDMSFTADIPQTGEENITCCTNGQPLPATPPSRKCAPIPITSKDEYNYPEGNTCLDFTRTSTNRDKGCFVPGKIEEPLTSVTSYLDISITYGNSAKQVNTLRAFKNGKFATVERNGEEWLPQDTTPMACNNVKNAQEPCYLAGDSRVNQNPQLAIVQTMFVREHNRIAEKLCVYINPQWSDERCFQEARRILIAKYQHITYNEFLPIFLGLQNMIDNKLVYPKPSGFVNDYDKNVNAQVLNEHATAAFRELHSLIVGNLKVYSEKRELTAVIRLSDWFGRPSVIEKYPTGLARGLCTQAQNSNDRFYDDEISQYFFRPLNELLGDDLHAADVQRSRDHGLATYAVMLKYCGLGKPKSFKDMEKYIKPDYVRLLMKIYKKPEDVELVIGALLETKVKGTLSGPTYLCIKLEQFKRSRIGDRYFYENEKAGFNKEQLNSIRKTTMARLFCDTFKDIKSIQPEAFRLISDTNALQSCNKIPQEDLWLWKEYPGQDTYGTSDTGNTYPGTGNTGQTNGGNPGNTYPGTGNTGATSYGASNTRTIRG